MHIGLTETSIDRGSHFFVNELLNNSCKLGYNVSSSFSGED